MSNHKFYVIKSLCLAGYAIALKINTCYVRRSKINIYQHKISTHVFRMRTGGEIYCVFNVFMDYSLKEPKRIVCVCVHSKCNNSKHIEYGKRYHQKRKSRWKIKFHFINYYDWWFYDKSSLFHISIFFFFFVMYALCHQISLAIFSSNQMS